jgi:hypothetical protein
MANSLNTEMSPSGYRHSTPAQPLITLGAKRVLMKEETWLNAEETLIWDPSMKITEPPLYSQKISFNPKSSNLNNI